MEEKKNIANKAEIPSFVYRDGMLADMEYVEWLADVKSQRLVGQFEDKKGQQLADQIEMLETWLTVRWLNWN